MIRSMTGFARAETRHHSGQLRWEIRSVNHRYLDIQFRLPDSLKPMEAEFRELLGEQVRRGKVDASLHLEFDRAAAGATRLNIETARRVIGYAKAVAAEIDRPAPLDPAAVLRWPGVIEEHEPELADIGPLASSTLSEAATALGEARAREGARIAAVLEDRCADILRLVTAVESRRPQVLAAIRSRLEERVQSLTAQTNPERLEQELVLIAQKLDVSEELERLKAHVAEVRDALQKDEAVGRRLDFLMQELNREANTLASKSADAKTTRHAVDLKVVIEQMREQVQNVE